MQLCFSGQIREDFIEKLALCSYRKTVNVLVNFLVCGWAVVRELRLSRWVLANSLSPDGLLLTELVSDQQHHPHLDAC